MVAQHGFVHARLVVKSLQPAFADQLEQVFVAGQVLSQENEVMTHPRQIGCGIGMIAVDVNLAPDDGLDPHIFAGHIEIGGPIQIAMVRNGRRGHAEILGPSGQVVDAYSPVKQAVFRVAMKMDKVGHGEVSPG